jgi:hypothetical protein
MLQGSFIDIWSAHGDEDVNCDLADDDVVVLSVVTDVSDEHIGEPPTRKRNHRPQDYHQQAADWLLGTSVSAVAI